MRNQLRTNPPHSKDAAHRQELESVRKNGLQLGKKGEIGVSKKSGGETATRTRV